LQLDAFSITQRGGLEGVDIYITVFKAKDIVDRYRIDRWTMDNPEGYQRMPSESRLMDRRGSPLRYLVREWGCFPTSILLNIRGDVKYVKEKDLGWFSYGMRRDDALLHRQQEAEERAHRPGLQAPPEDAVETREAVGHGL
jgi:hypothetical protein